MFILRYLNFTVPPKSGQKRAATVPAALLSSTHHLQSPSTVAVSGSSLEVPSPSATILSHGLPTNHIDTQSPSLAQQYHQSHQQVVAIAQVQPQLVSLSSSLNSVVTSARGPFAAALRNLAKQADINEDEEVVVRDRSECCVAHTSIDVASSRSVVPISNSARIHVTNDRISSTVISSKNVEDRSCLKKRALCSPQPGEKIARLNPPMQTNTIQPELLARSGFQPYRSDERLLHPAGAFPLDAYTHFAGFSAIGAGTYLNPSSLPYSEQLYLDQRYQMLRAAGAHHSHPHALYPPLTSPYASHLYSMIPSATLSIGPALNERLKLEEEHRARIAREEEREREVQRDKEREMREQRERELREKDQREREQREKEHREKEQKEKASRERELIEKEREARERDRQQLLSASHHYSNQMYSPLNRNLLGSMIPQLNLSLRAPLSGLHGIPGISPYQSANQRQSPHISMGRNISLSALSGVPALSHTPPNLPHPLQQAGLGLSQPVGAGLAHPGFSAAAVALGFTHHSLNLTHSHISPRHAIITSAHQMPNTSTAASTSHGGINLSPSTSSGLRHTEPNSITSLAPSLQTPSSIAQPTSSLSFHTPSMSSSHYYNHSSQPLAAIHAVAASAASSAPAPTVSHHQIPVSLQFSPAGNSNHSHPLSPTNTKTTVSSGNPTNSSVSNSHYHNGKRVSSKSLSMRHVATPSQQSTLEKSGKTAPVDATSTHEPAMLDLTGSNSNSSNQASLTSSGPQNIGTIPMLAEETNEIDVSVESIKGAAIIKENPNKTDISLTTENPPSSISTTITHSNTSDNMLISVDTPKETCRSSPNITVQLVELNQAVSNSVGGTVTVTGNNSDISKLGVPSLNQMITTYAKDMPTKTDVSSISNSMLSSMAGAKYVSVAMSITDATTTTSGTISPPGVCSSTNYSVTSVNKTCDDVVSSATSREKLEGNSL